MFIHDTGYCYRNTHGYFLACECLFPILNGGSPQGLVNLESHGIRKVHFPGLECHGKKGKISDKTLKNDTVYKEFKKFVLVLFLAPPIFNDISNQNFVEFIKKRYHFQKLQGGHSPGKVREFENVLKKSGNITIFGQNLEKSGDK